MEAPWRLGTELLSKEEAEKFCRGLGISLEQRPRELLDAIVKGVNAMPFHNVNLLAVQPAERRPPSALEAKAAMLSGEGGLCFVKQAFAGHLLEALGYKVEVLSARVTHPGNHVVILTHDVVEKGDTFLVEVGSGYPSNAAVPLSDSFEHHFKDSFLEFRYVKSSGESLVRREHRRGDPPRPVVSDSLGRPGEFDGWRRFFDFFWPQKDGAATELAQGMLEVCTMPEASPFLTSLRAVRWVDGKMIAVKDASLLEEQEGGEIKATMLKDAKEVKETLARCFPELAESKVEAAVEHWWSKFR